VSLLCVAKASLTASRTAANSIYVVPILQAEIDEMSGVLHCEEGDHVTAFSYFLEAFDGYDQSEDSRALISLKYMILAKVLSDNASDVPGVLGGKMAIKHQGEELTAMAAVAKSAQKRSLEDFKKTVSGGQCVCTVCSIAVLIVFMNGAIGRQIWRLLQTRCPHQPPARRIIPKDVGDKSSQDYPSLQV
jgi:hypothetical protein